MTVKPSKSRAKHFPQRALIVVFIAVAVLTGGVITVIILNRQSSQYGRVTINGQVFRVEIADSEPARTFGLMFRENLPERTGMLFIFDRPDIRSFWMRNTYIPLDIIFIDEDKTIINYATMPPQTDDSCRSDRPALYVLELEAGSMKRYGLEPGQKVEIKLPSR